MASPSYCFVRSPATTSVGLETIPVLIACSEHLMQLT